MFKYKFLAQMFQQHINRLLLDTRQQIEEKQSAEWLYQPKQIFSPSKVYNRVRFTMNSQLSDSEDENCP